MISFIIPTLNEETEISGLLNQISTLKNVEVIVVDGGSNDRTIELVKEFDNVKIISTDRGRGLQMNKGAKIAQGDFLLFIHADCRLASGLINNLNQIDIEVGTFKMRFNSNGVLYKLYSWFTTLNWTVFTYGDQGLWVKKSIFEKVGGFKELPLLEDLEIISRLKKITKFQKLSYYIYTSPRRFAANGILKQQLINIFIVSAYYLGFSPHFLSRYYRY